MEPGRGGQVVHTPREEKEQSSDRARAGGWRRQSQPTARDKSGHSIPPGAIWRRRQTKLLRPQRKKERAKGAQGPENAPLSGAGG